MDFRLLTYFTTLIDKGSFTQAAKALHISQPSLSSAVRKLEDDVNLTLINRSTRAISLTKEGEILYIEAKKLLNHFHHLENEVARLRESGPTEIQIGLIESVNFWLPKVIASYRESYPNIHIKLKEVLGLKQVEQALLNYKIHFAITNQYFENEEIKAIPIYKENLVAVLPKDHPLTCADKISLKDLKDEDFIISQEGFQTRQDILNEFRKCGIQPKIQFEIERFETGCSLVEEGLGITILPENYMKSTHHPNLAVKPITNKLSRTIYIALLKERFLPPNVDKFIELSKDFFAEERIA